jgi:hypothetical protein
VSVVCSCCLTSVLFCTSRILSAFDVSSCVLSSRFNRARLTLRNSLLLLWEAWWWVCDDNWISSIRGWVHNWRAMWVCDCGRYFSGWCCVVDDCVGYVKLCDCGRYFLSCVVKACVGHVELCDCGGYFLCCECMIVPLCCEYVIVDATFWVVLW